MSDLSLPHCRRCKRVYFACVCPRIDERFCEGPDDAPIHWQDIARHCQHYGNTHETERSAQFIDDLCHMSRDRVLSEKQIRWLHDILDEVEISEEFHHALEKDD